MDIWTDASWLAGVEGWLDGRLDRGAGRIEPQLLMLVRARHSFHAVSATERPDPLNAARRDVDKRLHGSRLREDREKTTRRRERLDAQLATVSDADLRRQLEETAADVEEFCCRLVASSHRAAERRTSWAVFAAVGAALAAVAATAGGSTLIAGLTGTWSTVLGILVLLAGILGATFNALGSQQEHERSETKRRAYDALWFEVWNYALYELVHVHDRRERAQRLNEFNSRWQQIGESERERTP